MKARHVGLAGAMVVAILLATTAQSRATATLYTDRAAFLAAATGLTNIDFEENASGDFTDYSGGPAVFSGVSFTTAASLFTIDPDLLPSLYEWGSGDVLSRQGTLGSGEIVATLPGSFTAAGADVMPFGIDEGSPVTATASTGENGGGNVSGLPRPMRAFIGLVSDVPFTSITFELQSAGNRLHLDNFVFGSAIPEPTTALLLATGLAGLAVRRRRLHQGNVPV